MADGEVSARFLLGVVAMATLLPACRPRDLQRLLLVSFDGFRWDYVRRVPAPNFRALLEEGVGVEQIESAYVTETFPDHYTLVTGLFAESHGVVANEMYDPDLNATFAPGRPGSRDPRWWDGAEPLWVTNQRAGHGSGAVMWPGSDVPIRGTYPTRYLPYNGSVEFEERVRGLLGWFSRGGEEEEQPPIRLGLLYWEEPDLSGHAFGPDSPLMDDVIADVDAKLGFLREELRKAGLYERVNLVVTSDHGMAQMSPERVVELDEYLSRDQYTWVGKSPVVGILPREGRLEEVYHALAGAHPSLRVYRKEEIPERFHYRHSGRIMPLVLAAEEGWTVVQNRSDGLMHGNHGYDNALPSMHPVFVARGPAFRQGYNKTWARSVDLYPLMCHILDLPPAPNNGSLANVRDLLREATPPPTPAPPPRVTDPTYARVVGSLLGVALVGGFLLVFLRQVTLRQLPATPIGNMEISRPLLQDHLEI
ncbi:ectonucleotide pyrophosphatase/phosphodiesterase family member 5 [Conger conger]|uniref:ectonucleotide pyrophosphatase/phosphodiesterase family member 5 n=1 Tax=Conger conger TaxID=82655 RepID=UPI002A59DFA0|nr:ectonucleotide pyrophosphatase/phosphodiesterase family member 5 [Conger conger]